MEQREWIVEAEAAGQRIDRFLSGEDTGLSRSALQSLVADGHVRCNGKAVAKSLKLKPGDIILLEIPDAKPIEAVPQEIPLDIVYGGFAQDEGFVESNLGRSKTDRKKMAVYPSTEPHTKYAYTGYRVLERLGEFTMLECRLKTGRTHQIRVHMASIHHPVAGDPVYGPHNCITSLHGQCLHAKTLGFVHPITGEFLRFDSELPAYFTHFLATLRRGKS